jgi:hypothetical protein
MLLSISAELPDEGLEAVLQAIATFRQKLPFLVLLPAGDKKSSPMLDEGRVPFALKAVEYASREKAISPNPPLLHEAQKDLALFTRLQTVERELSRLSEMVSDTRMLAGAELYQFARVTYKMSKIVASLNVPGTKSIVDDLGILFTGQGKTVQTETPLVALYNK